MALVVCRNRRATTLSALDRLRRQTVSADVSIAVFDDASDDGTPEAIAQSYPDVKIIHGDGNAFWNGGLHQLWSTVHKTPVDAFLWLNDDTILDNDALFRLTEAWKEMQANTGDERFILVGATRGTRGEVSYGGFDVVPSPFAFRLVSAPPHDTALRLVKTFNGNIVLVSRDVVKSVGLNDPGFFHNLGDIDYGLRAQQAGIPIALLPGTLGLCAPNETKTKYGYGSPHLSVFEQWRKVSSHHGLPPRSWWRFTRRHSGSRWLLHFLLPYRHLVSIWRLRSRENRNS